MNNELFWMHKSFFGDAQVDGFSVFSMPHLLWLSVLLVLTVVSAFSYRRLGERGKDNLREGMALFLILFEIFKYCVMALTNAPVKEHLPLEICSFALYFILVDALWPKIRFTKQPMAFIFLPAAMMALLFPTVTVYPPISFYAIHQFLVHGVIAAYVIARYAAGEIRPRYRGLWLSMLLAIVMAAPIYLVNLRFGTNFMFLMHHRGNPLLRMLWNFSGGNGGFLFMLTMVAFVLFVLHIVYAIYALVNWAVGRLKA